MGPGAAGKSTLALCLGKITGLPVIELDKLFWPASLVAMPRDHWAAIQRELTRRESWIMDGDLGPYDVVDVRLQAADTVVFLDFSLARCAWRAFRRSRERADFWRWLFSYRRRSRPLLRQAIAEHAGDADIYVLRTPHAVRRFVAQAASGRPGPPLSLRPRKQARRGRRTAVADDRDESSAAACEATHTRWD